MEKVLRMDQAKRRIIIHIGTKDDDELFGPVEQWITYRDELAKQSRIVILSGAQEAAARAGEPYDHILPGPFLKPEGASHEPDSATS